MRITHFKPAGDLIIVQGYVWGPRKKDTLTLVFDTGASYTSVSMDVLDRIGLGARQGETITKVRSAVAEEPGFFIRLPRFRVLDYEFDHFLVNAIDLPDDMGIDGLVGLNFLRLFDYEVRSGLGEIAVTPAQRVAEG